MNNYFTMVRKKIFPFNHFTEHGVNLVKISNLYNVLTKIIIKQLNS